MNNLLSKSWFRFISLILIHAFLMLDVAWAGSTELSVVTPNKMLNAQVQISQPDFTVSFDKFYAAKGQALEHEDIFIAEKAQEKKWSWNGLFQKIADSKTWQWTKNKSDLIAQANRLNKRSDDNDSFNGLKSIAIMFLVPAFIITSAGFGWAGDGVVAESFNWIKDFVTEHWIVYFGISFFIVMVIVGIAKLVKNTIEYNKVAIRQEKEVELAGGKYFVEVEIGKKTKHSDLIGDDHILEAARLINKGWDFNVEYFEGELYDPRQDTHPNEQCPDNYDIFGHGYPCSNCEIQMDDSHLIRDKGIIIVAIQKSSGQVKSAIKQQATENYQQQPGIPDLKVLEQITSTGLSLDKLNVSNVVPAGLVMQAI